MGAMIGMSANTNGIIIIMVVMAFMGTVHAYFPDYPHQVEPYYDPVSGLIQVDGIEPNMSTLEAYNVLEEYDLVSRAEGLQ